MTSPIFLPDHLRGLPLVHRLRGGIPVNDPALDVGGDYGVVHVIEQRTAHQQFVVQPVPFNRERDVVRNRVQELHFFRFQTGPLARPERQRSEQPAMGRPADGTCRRYNPARAHEIGYGIGRALDVLGDDGTSLYRRGSADRLPQFQRLQDASRPPRETPPYARK